jgi:hypothetical protein
LTDIPELRSLSLGELLDFSFAYFRKHFWLFAAIMAVPQAAVMAVIFAYVGYEAWIESISAYKLPVLHLGGLRIFVAGSWGTFLITFAYLLAYAVAFGALTFAVSEIHLGHAITARAAYRRLGSRLGSLIRLNIAVFLRVLLVFLLVAIALIGSGALGGVFLAGILGSFPMAPAVPLLGMSAFFAGIICAVIFAARYGCAVPALLLENLSPGPALRRSVTLTRKNLGRVFLLTALMALLNWTAAVVLQGPFMATALVVAVRHPTHPPLWLTVAENVAGGAGHAAAAPLVVIVLVLLYYDIRIRKEGFDLQVVLSALDAPTPQAQPATVCALADQAYR